ncbi:MAG TPA: glycosyltransferase family 2 protein [Marmoricola sp.]|nr:glycosyltransferase family 2 protein [Marmoricola sp.]
MSDHVDISAVIVAHEEGPMAGPSFRSLLDGVGQARTAGLAVEVLVVLDNPDAVTAEQFSEAAEQGARLLQTSYGDHGLVRNHVAGVAAGDYLAFLDGDDLWSENWLVEAHDLCLTDPGRIIAHPEVNWFFGEATYRYFLPDQTDPDFDVHAYIRFANPWDAMCMAPTAAYRDHPHSRRSLDEGFAYDDWHFNMETLLAGYVHRVARETIVFKRRRRGSQFTVASANRSLPRPTRVHDYAWLQEHG